MATQPQIQANRLNARKSTGPKTPEGKAAVAQNALKHGLSARRDVIITESQAEFDIHRSALLAEFAPQGPMESILADRIVTLSWRLRRAEAIQNQTIDAMHEKTNSSPLAKLAKSLRLKGLPTPNSEPTDSDPDLTLGRIALKDFSSARVLDRLLMYERRIEHSLFKTTLELQRLHLLRNLTPADPNPDPAPAAPPTTNPLNRTPAHPRIPIPRQPIVNNQSSIVNIELQRLRLLRNLTPTDPNPTPAAPPTTNPLNRTPAQPRIPIPRQPIVNNQSSIVNIESPPNRTTHPSQNHTPAQNPRDTLHASRDTLHEIRFTPHASRVPQGGIVKTNPIPKTPKPTQTPPPQAIMKISRPAPPKKTNPIQIEAKPRSRCTSGPNPPAPKGQSGIPIPDVRARSLSSVHESG